jgi:hypothetical protein
MLYFGWTESERITKALAIYRAEGERAVFEKCLQIAHEEAESQKNRNEGGSLFGGWHAADDIRREIRQAFPHLAKLEGKK